MPAFLTAHRHGGSKPQFKANDFSDDLSKRIEQANIPLPRATLLDMTPPFTATGRPVEPQRCQAKGDLWFPGCGRGISKRGQLEASIQHTRMDHIARQTTYCVG